MVTCQRSSGTGRPARPPRCRRRSRPPPRSRAARRSGGRPVFDWNAHRSSPPGRCSFAWSRSSGADAALRWRRARGRGGRPSRRGARAARRSRRPPRPPTSRRSAARSPAKCRRTSSSGCTDGGMAGTDATPRPQVERPRPRSRHRPWPAGSPPPRFCVGSGSGATTSFAETGRQSPKAMSDEPVAVGAGPGPGGDGRVVGEVDDLARVVAGRRRATRSARRPRARRAARRARAGHRRRPVDRRRADRRPACASPRPGAGAAGCCRPGAAAASRCPAQPGPLALGHLGDQRVVLRLDLGPGPERRPARGRRRAASQRIRPSADGDLRRPAGPDRSRSRSAAAASSAPGALGLAVEAGGPLGELAARGGQPVGRGPRDRARAASSSPCRRLSVSVRRAALKRTAWARISASSPSASEGSSRPTSSFQATRAAVRSRAASSSSRVIASISCGASGSVGSTEPAQVQAEVAVGADPGQLAAFGGRRPGEGDPGPDDEAGGHADADHDEQPADRRLHEREHEPGRRPGRSSRGCRAASAPATTSSARTRSMWAESIAASRSSGSSSSRSRSALDGVGQPGLGLGDAAVGVPEPVLVERGEQGDPPVEAGSTLVGAVGRSARARSARPRSGRARFQRSARSTTSDDASAGGPSPGDASRPAARSAHVATRRQRSARSAVVATPLLERRRCARPRR